jgi:glucose-6-phosphate isomerase
MTGKSESQVREELADKAISPKDIDTLTPFKIFEGNKPTNTLLIDRLTPSSLGALIALYEHKIFVQGIIWNIYSYDQWGVELGKQLATTILTDIVSTKIQKHDASTTALLNDFKKSQ